MSFMKTIFKRLRESDIEDLLVEAGLIAEGSVVRAFKGGYYNRARRLYKLFYEASYGSSGYCPCRKKRVNASIGVRRILCAS